jgi:hypothetical protein
MQLDSARQLKRVLADTVLASLATPIQTRALGLPARPLAGLGETPPTIALGIVHQKKREYALAVRIQQRALENSKPIDTIKKQAKGEVDVRYIGRLAKRAVPWYQQRNRPLRVGSSVGHFKITAGTLGCFVRDRASSSVLILSNNHVLANENRARKGDNILQPGTFDDGKDPADVVGTLLGFVKLKREGSNQVDAAVAAINDGIDFHSRELKGIGKLAGLGDEFLDYGTGVAKVGRTTGATHGRVTAFELDNLVIAYDIGNLRFDDQVEIESAAAEPFDRGGDSGSLIVDEERKGVALLFAGSDVGGANGLGLTYANSLRSVLEELQVDLVY